MQVRINKKDYAVEAGKTILDVCLENGIDVPFLCFHPELKPEGRCRMCIVNVDDRLMTSCNLMVKAGMQIETHTEEIEKLRKLNLELMLSNNKELLNNGENEVAKLAEKYNIKKEDLHFEEKKKTVDDLSPSLVRDNSKCILCGKCVQKCQQVQNVNAIGFIGRSHFSEIAPPFNHSLNAVSCIFCGQCSNVCPTGAIKEKEHIEEVKAAILDPNKIVVVQTAPAVRATLGETQGMPPGSLVTGKIVVALKQLGFDKVLDTAFAADLTIIEEGTGLIQRIKEKGILPMITSCSPGWIKFIEHFYPDLLPHLSSCKSPQQMFGAIVKTYYAEKNNIDPKNIVCVSIMPCTAKKYECTRPGMDSSGQQDVDYVLTTRELGKWLNEEGVKLSVLPDEQYDPLMGEASGAGTIFGATGGVMEAALRYVADKLEGKELDRLDYTQVRGFESVKESTVNIAGTKLNVAVVNGVGNVRKLLDDITAGKSKYHFIEVMACVGGCIGGGGQPMPTTRDIIKKRAEALYKADSALPVRKSHKNPEIIKLYADYLGEPGSKKARKLLYTKYVKRNKYSD